MIDTEDAVYTAITTTCGQLDAAQIGIAHQLAKLILIGQGHLDAVEHARVAASIGTLRAMLPLKPVAVDTSDPWHLDWLDDRALAVLKALGDLAHAAAPSDLSEEAVALLRSAGCGRKQLTANEHRDLPEDEFDRRIAEQDHWTALLAGYEPPADLVEENAALRARLAEVEDRCGSLYRQWFAVARRDSTDGRQTVAAPTPTDQNVAASEPASATVESIAPASDDEVYEQRRQRVLERRKLAGDVLPTPSADGMTKYGGAIQSYGHTPADRFDNKIK